MKQQMGAPHADPPALSYAPRPPASRKWIGRVVRCGLLILAAGVIHQWGPSWWEHAQYLYHNRQAMNFALPDDTVMYDSDPLRAATLLRNASDYGRVRDAHFGLAMPGSASRLTPATLDHLPHNVEEHFLASHQRRTANRLVLLLLHYTVFDGDVRFIAAAYDPPSSLPGSRSKLVGRADWWVATK